MKRRPSAELDAALASYASLIRRYHGTLDLMSDAGLTQLEEHVGDATAYVDAISSISPAPTRLLDLGSGVGLPGVVIAAALPDLAVELVERRRKRAAFLRMALAAVGRPDAVVHACDVRATTGPEVDVVTAQAVARLAEVYGLVRRRTAQSVVLMARKGDAWGEEVEQLARAVRTGAGAAPNGGDASDPNGVPQPTYAAESPSATTVLEEKALPRRGTLVAVRVRA